MSERELWEQLAECINKNESEKTKKFLLSIGLYEEFKRKVEQYECSRFNSKTEKVL